MGARISYGPRRLPDSNGIGKFWEYISQAADANGNRRDAKTGKRILIIVPEQRPTPINVVVNWLATRQK
jgi:hypothetical protein